ncbi:MAG TPA: helix-turn-helix domain-containing protein [Candidatus Kapabacteria bacterium]|nr:helix-turn-helix domain-containing protein [Candidatus Kapabacteria bacterium]
MARTKGSVQESLGMLLELEAQHQGTSTEVKLRMLRLLKEQPGQTLASVAAKVGRSERCAQRWWSIYKEAGLNGFIAEGSSPRGKSRRIGEEVLAELQEKLNSDGFSRLSEIQAWLQEKHRISYSRSGIWNIVRTSLNAAPGGWQSAQEAPAGSPAEAPPAPTALGDTKSLVSFLNSLPTSNDTIEWASQFRDTLQSLLPDVDRISISVNRDCSLEDPENYSMALIVTQGKVGRESTVTIQRADGSHAERMIEDYRRQGAPLDQFHPPTCYEYFYGGTAYIGTVILWRDKTKPVISEESKALIASLEPFILFSLSDLVARHQSLRPIDRVFHGALMYLVEDASLSPQEERIVVLQLMGHSYKEMADILSVTVDTVKKHFKQIHRKTGTRGQAELFAKYFTSRLIPDSFREMEQPVR